MKFTERALNFDYKLTELEDDLVEYIIANKEEVVKISITILARQFFSVPNTITRFCHKLEYDGFVDLKSHLTWELEQENKGVKKSHSTKSYLLKNLDLIDFKREKRFVEFFNKAKAVTFFAVGQQTGEVTKICIDNFHTLDSKFNFETHPNTVSHKISHSEDEVFFFISLSGETESIKKLAKEAKSAGHVIISLTQLSNNSLSQNAILYPLNSKMTICSVQCG